MDENTKLLLERQGYRIVGHHTGVKLCHWTKKKLTCGQGCYKETFYGIQSHRCLQMTPAVDYCNLNCSFCWRSQTWAGARQIERFDEPEFVFEGSIDAQRKLLSGFGGNPKVDRDRFEEAWTPNQVAISLTGEPTLYPGLSDLVGEFRRHGMTTFLVTNGTTPRLLAGMDHLPTQLYVSVTGPNKEAYNKVTAPTTHDAWEKLNQTVDLLPSLDTRVVVRHTLVDGWNMEGVEDYAKLDARAQPDFIECKGYAFMGESRLRLTPENAPSHARVREFAEQLAERTGYEVRAEREDSRVVLLTPKRGSTKVTGP